MKNVLLIANSIHFQQVSHGHNKTTNDRLQLKNKFYLCNIGGRSFVISQRQRFEENPMGFSSFLTKHLVYILTHYVLTRQAIKFIPKK